MAPQCFQDRFDLGAKHLMTQKKKAVITIPYEREKTCAYRANELKCIIGAAIPDEQYDPSMEGRSIGEILYEAKRWPKGLPQLLLDIGKDDAGLDFLFFLQNIHDYKPVDEWKECLKQAAKEFNLKCDHIKELE